MGLLRDVASAFFPAAAPLIQRGANKRSSSGGSQRQSGTGDDFSDYGADYGADYGQDQDKRNGNKRSNGKGSGR